MGDQPYPHLNAYVQCIHDNPLVSQNVHSDENIQKHNINIHNCISIGTYIGFVPKPSELSMEEAL